MFLAESAEYPVVAEIARSAYDRLAERDEIDYRILNDLIGEASGKGVLRAMRAKYGPAGFDAIVMPVLREIGRSAPVRSSRSEWTYQPGTDPLA